MWKKLLTKSGLTDSSQLNSAQMSNDDINELLINEVKSFNCIWDSRCRGFKERDIKGQGLHVTFLGHRVVS